jgi:hypothetical protein
VGLGEATETVGFIPLQPSHRHRERLGLGSDMKNRPSVIVHHVAATLIMHIWFISLISLMWFIWQESSPGLDRMTCPNPLHSRLSRGHAVAIFATTSYPVAAC